MVRRIGVMQRYFADERLKPTVRKELRDIVKTILQPGKGLLAADESSNTFGNRIPAARIENTEENRRQYRQLLFTSGDNLCKFAAYWYKGF